MSQADVERELNLRLAEQDERAAQTRWQRAVEKLEAQRDECERLRNEWQAKQKELIATLKKSTGEKQ
jgi:hypothetical protein